MKSPQILFITGTDTGVGKTVFAALSTVYLRQNGFRVAALKPLCSGGRDDARVLHAAAGKVLSLDEVNPWYFRAPLAPLLAADASTAPMAATERRPVRLLDIAVSTGAERFLFASSGSVYGKQPPDIELLNETYPGRPIPGNLADAYAISGEAKRQAELLCSVYADRHRLETVIARGFTFAGPGMPLDGKFAFGNFMQDALAGRPVVVTGDGTPVRSYLHAIDLTVWLWTMLARGVAGRAYNLGSEQPVTLRELAVEIAGEFGLPEVRVLQSPQPGQLGHRYVPSTARARSELGLRQTIGLKEAIRRSAKWWGRGVQR